MGSSTPRPWARGDQTLSGVITARKDDTAQHRRQTVRQVPPKRATPGSMQGFTRAHGTATWLSQGPQIGGWTFDTTVDQSPAEKPTLALDGSGYYIGPTEAGWYSTHASIQFTVGGTPTGVLVQANLGSGDLSAFEEKWAFKHLDGRWRTTVSCPKFWCDGVSFPIGLQAYINGVGPFTAGGLFVTFIDVHRIG
jgi:hypothetical protein